MDLFSRSHSQSLPSGESPKIPDGFLVYAVGDVHGNLRLMMQLLSKIEADAEPYDSDRKIIIFLGDIIDRGADSRAVVELLMRDPFCLPAFECVCLKGNHEQVMLDFLDHPETGYAWFQFGGVETLASYGVRVDGNTSDPANLYKLRDEARRAVCPDHVAFLRTLKTRFSVGDYFFVHAGVRPGISLPRQSVEDLLWIREPFLSSTSFHGKIVVHGHTPYPTLQDHPNRIGIDTGAYATGILTALALRGGGKHFLQACLNEPIQSAGSR